jgi:hypothetical protein
LAIFSFAVFAEEPSSTANTGLKASDYAQAVPIMFGGPIATSQRTRLGYRLILPISAAMFLTSFSVWSLQSIPNRAVETLSRQSLSGAGNDS